MNSSPPQIPVQPAALEFDLPNLGKALGSKDAVKIVALGSSTMDGEGDVVAFPYRLEAALREGYKRRYANQRRMIDVINRGIGGEEAPKELKRMDRDVFAENPCVVIWQIGTNAVWQKDADTPTAEDTISALREGVDRLIAAGGIDIVLMDPQYTPAMLKPEILDATNKMVSEIAKVASEKRVNLFRRFALMQAWNKLEGIPIDDLVDKNDPYRLDLHDSDYATQRLASDMSRVMWDAVDRAAT
jgi:hypothetical protein